MSGLATPLKQVAQQARGPKEQGAQGQVGGIVRRGAEWSSPNTEEAWRVPTVVLPESPRRPLPEHGTGHLPFREHELEKQP